MEAYLKYFASALNEELTKVIIPLALYFFTKHIDRPFDFVFLCIGGAIGFSFIEAYQYGTNYNDYIQIPRFISHISYSILFGYYFSLFIFNNKLSQKYDKSKLRNKIKASNFEIKSYKYIAYAIIIPSLVHSIHNIIVIYHFSYIRYFLYFIILLSFTVKKLNATQNLAPFESISNAYFTKLKTAYVITIPKNYKPHFILFAPKEEPDGKIRHFITDSERQNHFEIFIWTSNNSIEHFDFHYDINNNEKMISWKNNTTSCFEVVPEKIKLFGMKKVQTEYSIFQNFKNEYMPLFKTRFDETIANDPANTTINNFLHFIFQILTKNNNYSVK